MRIDHVILTQMKGSHTLSVGIARVESDKAVPSETCPVSSTESNGVYGDGWNLLVVVVLAIVSFASAIPL